MEKHEDCTPHIKYKEIPKEVQFLKTFQKPLTADEEKYYLERCQAGDQQAKDVLVERNLRLVAHIAKKYQGLDEDQDDLISIGTIGLIKGISSYKPEKNVRLATYAARCIENATLTEWHALAIRSQKKHRGGTPCSIWLMDCI